MQNAAEHAQQLVQVMQASGQLHDCMATANAAVEQLAMGGRAWASPRTRSPLSLLPWSQKTQVQVPMRGSSCTAVPGASVIWSGKSAAPSTCAAWYACAERCWPPTLRAARMHKQQQHTQEPG